VDTSSSGNLRLTYLCNQLRPPKESGNRIRAFFFSYFLTMTITTQMRLKSAIEEFVWQNSLPENQRERSFPGLKPPVASTLSSASLQRASSGVPRA